jgi:hypothetical protein
MEPTPSERRLRPMRGLRTGRNRATMIAGHAFVQNIRRGHYELGVDDPARIRVSEAFAAVREVGYEINRLAIKERLLGSGHPEIARLLNNLATLLQKLQRTTERTHASGGHWPSRNVPTRPATPSRQRSATTSSACTRDLGPPT